MEIKTKFRIGDSVWTIRDCKAVCFKIGCIIYDGAIYYGETRYNTMNEQLCFGTKEELLAYISADGNENM